MATRGLLLGLCTLVLLATFQASGHAIRSDSDGRVPLIWECFGLDDQGIPEGQHRWAKTVSRAWPSKDNVKEYRNEIHLDWCRIYLDGGGPYDLYKIYLHEMAHAKDGYEHGEGTPEENPAFYETTRLTGF